MPTTLAHSASFKHVILDTVQARISYTSRLVPESHALQASERGRQNKPFHGSSAVVQNRRDGFVGRGLGSLDRDGAVSGALDRADTFGVAGQVE